MRDSYRIVRLYRDDSKKTKTIKRGLTLEKAQTHCRREDTHEKDSQDRIIWFDGYEKE